MEARASMRIVVRNSAGSVVAPTSPVCLRDVEEISTTV